MPPSIRRLAWLVLRYVPLLLLAQRHAHRLTCNCGVPVPLLVVAPFVCLDKYTTTTTTTTTLLLFGWWKAMLVLNLCYASLCHVVRVQEDAEQYDSMEMVERLDTEIQRVMDLSKRVQQLDDLVSCEHNYLSKVTHKERQARWGDGEVRQRTPSSSPSSSSSSCFASQWQCVLSMSFEMALRSISFHVGDVDTCVARGEQLTLLQTKTWHAVLYCVMSCCRIRSSLRRVIAA